MAQVMRKPRRASLGKTPTQSQKLIYVSDKLNLGGIKDQQGSTVNIFDTVPLATNATGRQTLNFFASTANKSRNFSNFQNLFTAGEAMVIEEIMFLVVSMTNADMTSDANAITAMYSLMGAPEATFPNAEGAILGMMGIKIGNSTVLKNYNTVELHPSFNRQTTGVTVFDTATATNRFLGSSRIALEAPPVLPPNMPLSITWEIGITGTVAANTGIMCIAGRFGSIFSAKTTL
jgi:hypothetical protein